MSSHGKQDSVLYRQIPRQEINILHLREEWRNVSDVRHEQRLLMKIWFILSTTNMRTDRNYEKMLDYWMIRNHSLSVGLRFWANDYPMTTSRVVIDAKIIPEQTESLNKIIDSKPEYYMWLQDLAYKLFPDFIDKKINKEERYKADFIHVKSIESWLEDFIELLKKKDVLLVWPDRIKHFDIYKDFIEIPLIDCFYDRHRIFDDICKILDKSENKIVLYIAWATTNDLIDMVYNKYGNKHTQIDIGSAFDPYAWIISRIYHNDLSIKKIDAPISNRLSEINQI